jgi:hypothetical protein
LLKIRVSVQLKKKKKVARYWHYIYGINSSHDLLARLRAVEEVSSGCTYWLRSNESDARIQPTHGNTVSGALSKALCIAGSKTLPSSSWFNCFNNGAHPTTISNLAPCLQLTAVFTNASSKAG